MHSPRTNAQSDHPHIRKIRFGARSAGQGVPSASYPLRGAPDFRFGWRQPREKASGGRPTKVSNDTTLSDLGISRDQSSQWQKLAAIPDEEFEADLKDPAWRPTTSGMIDRHEARERGPSPPRAVDDGALWLWGRLQDFERNGLLDRPLCTGPGSGHGIHRHGLQWASGPGSVRPPIRRAGRRGKRDNLHGVRA